MSGIVHLVGAGPGDPDLLTVRGRRLLEAADVVVHDRLVSADTLAIVPPGRRLLDVGKMAGRTTPTQDDINALLVDLGRAGRTVVRLKGGDPFLFGRGGEEVAALRAAGIRVEVVPGITAGIAAAAAAGIPVTQRGVARSVAFVTGATDPSSGGRPVDWARLAEIDTLIVYMAGRTAGSIGRSLLDAGRSPTTPVAFVIDATLPTQAIRRLDLSALAGCAIDPFDGRPAILIIGAVVDLPSGPASPEPGA